MYSTETVGDCVGSISALKLTGHAVVFHHVGHHILRVPVPAHHGLPVCLSVPRTPRQQNVWHTCGAWRHEIY